MTNTAHEEGMRRTIMTKIGVIGSIMLLLIVSGGYVAVRKTIKSNSIPTVCNFVSGQVVTLKTGHKAIVTGIYPTSNYPNQCRVYIFSYGITSSFVNSKLIKMVDGKELRHD